MDSQTFSYSDNFSTSVVNANTINAGDVAVSGVIDFETADVSNFPIDTTTLAFITGPSRPILSVVGVPNPIGSNITLRNPGASTSTTIDNVNPNVNLTVNIPNPGGVISNCDFVLTEGNQTINGVKSFTNLQGNQIVLTNTTNQITMANITLSGNTSVNRTYTIPDVNANANFIMSTGSQAFAGTLKFSNTVAMYFGSGVSGQLTQSLTLNTSGNNVTVLNTYTDATNNLVQIGGGRGGHYSCTSQEFYSAPNTTSTGNKTLVISNNGLDITYGNLTIDATSNQLVLGTTNSVTINSVAPAASRVHNIIDTANDTFVFCNATQTLTNKTLTSFTTTDVIAIGTDINLHGDVWIGGSGSPTHLHVDTIENFTVGNEVSYLSNINMGASILKTEYLSCVTKNINLNSDMYPTTDNITNLGTGLARFKSGYFVDLIANGTSTLNTVNASTLSITSLSASQVVATDASKNLVSIPYTNSAAANCIVMTNASGNIIAGNVFANGISSSATTFTIGSASGDIVISPTGGGINLPLLTASTIVALDSSKKLTSIAYSTSNVNNSIAQRDSGGSLTATNLTGTIVACNSLQAKTGTDISPLIDNNYSFGNVAAWLLGKFYTLYTNTITTISGNLTISPLTIFSTGLQLPTTGGIATTINYYEETTFNVSTSGSFVGTFTWSVTRVGKLVCVRIPDMQAIPTASNVILGSAGQIPSRFRPAFATRYWKSAMDNGATMSTPCELYVDPSGSFSFNKAPSTNWTNAGNKAGPFGCYMSWDTA